MGRWQRSPFRIRSGGSLTTTTAGRERRITPVANETHEALAGISGGELGTIEELLQLREVQPEAAGLDERTFSLVQIAALVALDAPPASYGWQVTNALEAGATPEDILGVLRAVAVQVGAPRVVAAAPEVMLALGLSLPDGNE